MKEIGMKHKTQDTRNGSQREVRIGKENRVQTYLVMSLLASSSACLSTDTQRHEKARLVLGILNTVRKE